MSLQTNHPSQALISIVLGTRTGATEYQGPIKLLTEMENTISNHQHVEVIIRGDNDDTGFDGLIDQIKAKNFSFHIDFVRGERGRGYEDLHNFYVDCLLVTSPQKKIVIVLPEDVLIRVNHWDQMLLDEYDAAEKKLGHRVFTLHQTLSPGLGGNFESTLEHPDPFPIYTSDWLNAWSPFGHTFSVDSWLIATHHYLLKLYGLNLRHFLPSFVFERSADIQDHISNPRWANARLRSHDILRSQRIQNVMKTQADVLRRLACKQMNKSNAEKFDLNELSYVLHYASEQHGTASVLIKSMYNIMNTASNDFLKKLAEASDSIATPLFTLKKVVSASDSYEDLLTPLTGDIKNLTERYNYGQPYLSGCPWNKAPDYAAMPMTYHLLKNTSLIRLFCYYVKFKIKQRKIIKNPRGRVQHDRTKQKKDLEKNWLNTMFWAVRIKPLVKLIALSKLRKTPPMGHNACES